MKPTLIIDADDTLWETEVYYEQCIADFGELMGSLGFDREEAEHIVDEVEQERVPLVGYGPHEFSGNLGLAYERLCERYGRPFDEEVAEAARQIGMVVLEPPMELLDGVAETLPRLGERFRLILLTKGDREVQVGKLERSGLAGHFEGVHIVQEKDVEVLRGLMIEYDLQPETTWMVGNSPHSDINPALEAGIGAVHIPHSNTWSFEQAEIINPERVIELRSFGGLLDLFGVLEGARDAGSDLSSDAGAAGRRAAGGRLPGRQSAQRGGCPRAMDPRDARRRSSDSTDRA